MRFEPRHVFRPDRQAGLRHESQANVDLPSEIAFLPLFGVDRSRLRAAAATAARDRVCAARALIAGGGLSAATYYAMLAAHLDVAFVSGWPEIDARADPRAAHRAGCLELAATNSHRRLVAPEDGTLHAMLRAGRFANRQVAITTPAHLAALIHYRMQGPIAQAASEALPDRAPELSARGAVDARAGTCMAVALTLTVLGAVWIPHVVAYVLGLAFFASMTHRLCIAAAGLVPPETEGLWLDDGDLPTYTVLVPLRQEDEILPDLLAALDAIDYPRAKLEVLVLIEPEDRVTRTALAAASLPPWLHVVLGPLGGELRTKPRALNIGLLMARGSLLTVYDAEDRPDADQLRKAAARFARAPARLACLQARLMIDNGDTCWLSRLFAIEYAALFDVLNIGMANLRLPLALGGTSNHFRTAILREVGGWDAWNVTEDADLGLRFAKLGYDVECFDSTTREAAPEHVPVWMKQRRRWTKGWLQTALVLVRDGPSVVRRMGWLRTGALALSIFNLVAGPLLFPPFCVLVTYRLISTGLPASRDGFEILEATVAVSVLVLGFASTLWCGYVGLRKRRLLSYLPSLPLLLPYQLLISAAAWLSVIDLIRRPYHWHKTVHHAARRPDRPILNHSSPAGQRQPQKARPQSRRG